MSEQKQISLPTRLRVKVTRMLIAGGMLATLSAPVSPSELETTIPPAGTGTGDGSTLLISATDPLDRENSLALELGEQARADNSVIPISAEPLGRMRGFADISRGSRQYATALQCMSQAIYYEAATESLQGQRAVAQVVLNRVRHPAYPSSVCGVVYQGWNAPVCQFSFVCDGALLRTPIGENWRRAQRTAEAALGGYVEESVGSATHYHADYVLPRWAYTLGKLTQIGRHIFYRIPGGGGSTRAFRASWIGQEHIPQIDFTRFEGGNTQETSGQFPGQDTAVALPFDPTDRRAPNDIGGRLDTSTGWQLEIPNPETSSSRFNRTREDQVTSANGTQ